MSKAELEDFHVSGRVLLSESTLSCDRAEIATSSISENSVPDEETGKSQFALPDELVAKVLGHLPLRDRFRLETVCRQWKRCMYLEVEHLYVKFRHKKSLEYTFRINDVGEITGSWTEELVAVFRKLRISKVDHLRCDIQDTISDRELFGLLADIASRATEVMVKYGIRHLPTNLVTFCDIIGPHITAFQLTLHESQGLPKDMQPFVDSFARMKRLKEVSSNWPGLIFTCLNSFPINSLPHFQVIEAELKRQCDWQLWEQFKSLYGAKLKKITFPGSIPYRDHRDKVLLPWKDMAPFANLEHLVVWFWQSFITLTTLTEDLEAISRNCPLLKSLALRHAAPMIERSMASLMEVQKLFVAVGKMKMLEKLDLYLSFEIMDLGESSSGGNLDLFGLLENKSNITHLKVEVILFQNRSPNESFRREICGSLNNEMPNLKHLDVCCMASELDHLVGLKKMQTICLDYFYSDETIESIQDSLIRILKCSPALRSIKFSYWFAGVPEALIGAIIEVAELQMEKHIDFFAEIAVFNESQEAWEAMKHLAPRNLTLIFDPN